MKKTFLASIAALTLCVPCFAQDMRVVGADYPPFTSIHHQTNAPHGFAFDIIAAIAADRNIRLTYAVYPWKRAEMILSNESATLAFLTRTPERESKYFWIGPVYPRGIWLYRKRGRSGVVLNSAQDAARYRIGVVNGYASLDEITTAGIPRKNIETVSHSQLNIRKLLAERIDLVPGNDLLMSALLMKEGHSLKDVEKAFIITPEGKSWYYFAVNRSTDENLVRRLRSSFEKIRNDGTYQRILEKYTR